MTISDATETFFGKKVLSYKSGEAIQNDSKAVYRLSLEYDAKQSMVELVEEFLSVVDKGALEALIIGSWAEPQSDSPDEALEVLIKHAAEIPNFKALFIGDMTYEECEISWIIQGNYKAFLQAFPNLEALRIRGSTSLELPAFTHGSLRQLVIESGGLPKNIFEALAQSSLPALDHLELWVGTSEYGFDGDLASVREAVDKLRSAPLRYLGLRDAEIADEITQWLAGETWIESLHVLDLSLGTLGDAGAQALCDSPHAAKISRIDLSHHYISDPLQEKLRATVPGVVLDDPQGADDEDRYVAVGE